MKRSELSRLSGVPYSTLRELEVNRREIGSGSVSGLANALEVSIDFLLRPESRELPLPAALSVESLRIFLQRRPREDEQPLYRVAIQADSPICVVDWQRLCELSDQRSLVAGKGPFPKEFVRARQNTD